MESIGCALPVFKKSYVDLDHQLASEVQNPCRKSEADWRELIRRDGKIKRLIL